MKLDPTLFSMQVEVPEWKYGKCDWFIHGHMHEWLREMGLDYSWAGSTSTGNGKDETTGRSTVYFTYMVRNCEEEDASAFGIQFPECKIYVCKQFEY